ncbi:helix-turn-helix domain-containing protein [Klebsiella aerogenes]
MSTQVIHTSYTSKAGYNQMTTQYELISKVAKHGNKDFNLSAANQLLLLTLLSYYSYQTKQCYPSNKSVSDGYGISVDNLCKNKKVLQNAGLLATYNKNMGDFNKHSGYILNIDFIESRLAEVINEEAVKEAVEASDSELHEEEKPFVSEEQVHESPFDLEV